MNFIVGKLVVLTGKDIRSYLGGQGTNLGVARVVLMMEALVFFVLLYCAFCAL